MATKNVTIKNRNSVVPGRAPTTSDLVLGELSINHEDGKLYALHTTSGSVDGVVQLNAGGGSALTVKDEGTNLSTATSSINFVGAGVTASNSGNDITVTISGGAFNQSNVSITGGSITGLSQLSINSDLIVRGMHLGAGQAGNTDNLVFGLGALQTLPPPTNGGDYSKSFNVALGTYVLGSLAGGANNLGIGSLALQTLPSGWDNIGIGAHAGQFLNSGANNILIGSTAGGGDWMDSWLTDGSDNIMIGTFSRPANSDDSNSIVIGSNAVGAGSNSVVIGNENTTLTKITGDLEVTGVVTSAGAKNGFARTGTNSERLAITLQAGEFFFCTDTNLLWIGTGTIAGGIQVSGGGTTDPTDFGSFSNDAATMDFGSFSNDAKTADYGNTFA